MGTREPEHYGRETLADIRERLERQAHRDGHELSFYQTNAEHELIDLIHGTARQEIACIIFNPAGFTHSSIALRDALLAVGVPFIEIHLSNTHAREPFRAHSYFSDIAQGVISGLGSQGYDLALQAAVRLVEAND